MPRKEPENNRNTFKSPPQEEPKKEKKSKAPAKKSAEKSPRKRTTLNPFAPVLRLLRDEKFQKIMGLFFLIFAFYLCIAFVSYLFTWKEDDNIFSSGLSGVFSGNDSTAENWMGKFGAFFSFLFIKRWFGLASFFFIFLFLISGLRLFVNTTILPIGKSFRYSFFGIIWISLLFGFFFTAPETLLFGGTFGYEGNQWLNSVLGKAGTGIFLFFSLLVFLIIAWNIHRVWQKKPRVIDDAIETEQTENFENSFSEEAALAADSDELSAEDDPTVLDFSIREDIPSEEIPLDIPEKEPEESMPQNDEIEFNVETSHTEPLPDNLSHIETIPTENEEHYGLDTPFDPTLGLRDYQFPGLDLLKEYDSGNVSVQNEELEANKNRIIKTLRNYSIEIEKINATIGPTVTLYEIVPAPGIRISKIKNLEDDIALSLSALGIRIIAPMPGKGTIGIEVPNQNPKVVSMRSVLGSEAFAETQYDLPVALGKTISNKPYIADLAKMPHLLIAGATGQGKSVGLNAIISSLLYKKHPAQLKFVMVDPKKVELTLFSKIERHYLAKLPDVDEAILTDNKKVVRTLNALCILMDERYELLKAAQVRNIKEYNAKFIQRKLNPEQGHDYMPYIVLIVDEFADLYMTAGKEVEYSITRLAQLARAVGIHLIIATQRPSVNVITGSIKANFPARIAFRVSAKVDSRTILDASGADQLIGRGDMLIATGSDILRLQCAFLDTPEVEAITDFIGSQRGFPTAYDLPECPEEDGGDNENSVDPSERDPLFADAARLLVAHQHGSTSLIQRKLKLGYNRAGRIIDQLEAAGILGPFEGSKAREVRIKDMAALEQLLENRNSLS